MARQNIAPHERVTQANHAINLSPVMSHQKCPWYVRRKAVDEYKFTLRNGSLPVLKTLKILRAIIVNIGIFGIGFYSLQLGGDPTLIAITVVTIVGGYNGLELSDYLALVKALQELPDQKADKD
jgi:hypothetical protein